LLGFGQRQRLVGLPISPLTLILFVEVESKATTVHMTGNLLFSVEEPLDSIAAKIEMIETGRIKNAVQQSGLIGK
jgi:hypothetical protein